MAKAKKVKIKDIEQNMLEELAGLDPASDDYRRVVNNYATLKESRGKDSRRVSGDTLVKAGASIGGVLLLLAFERNNVITTKLLGMLPKLKL